MDDANNTILKATSSGKFFVDGELVDKDTMERLAGGCTWCGPQLRLPQKREMLKNAVFAGKDILTSPSLSSTETFQRRIEMCDSCGFMTEEGRCGNTESDKRGCGCFMKVKARFKIMRCPRGLWEE